MTWFGNHRTEPTSAPPAEGCKVCGGTGWEPAENSRVRRCKCTDKQKLEQRLAAAAIPARYESAEFSNFSLEGDQQCFERALIEVKYWAELWPTIEHNSLLLLGPVGTGKTHLAVAALKALIRKGIAGVFYDYAGLLNEIRSTYDPESSASERDVLGPVEEIDVLVLDDLGAMRPSTWVLDTMMYLVRFRYNRGKATILTTNFSQEELEARIGTPAVSRLHELCHKIVLEGPDYRRKGEECLGR